ncbi:MAG: hypothetical protein AAF333_08285 [Planctomycetota bacterium]
MNDARTIKSVLLANTATGGEDGRATVFNDPGQLVFTLRFTDGSDGVFVATIPEPTSAAAAALVLLTGLFSLRRRA